MANQTTATKAIVAALTGASGVITALTTAFADGSLSQQDIVTVGSVLVTAVVTVLGVYFAPNVDKTDPADPAEDNGGTDVSDVPADDTNDDTPAVEPGVDAA